MPARRKSPRRSKSRSKSPRRSLKRRSSGKARRAAVRRSPKRRTYKGTRLYGMTGDDAAHVLKKRKTDLDTAESATPGGPFAPPQNPSRRKPSEAIAFAQYLAPNMTKAEATDLAVLLDPSMKEEDVAAFAYLLTGVTIGDTSPPEDTLETPPFTPQQVYDALVKIQDEPAAKQLIESEVLAQDPVKILVDHQETYERRIAEFREMTRQVEEEIGGTGVEVSGLLDA